VFSEISFALIIHHPTGIKIVLRDFVQFSEHKQPIEDEKKPHRSYYSFFVIISIVLNSTQPSKQIEKNESIQFPHRKAFNSSSLS